MCPPPPENLLPRPREAIRMPLSLVPSASARATSPWSPRTGMRPVSGARLEATRWRKFCSHSAHVRPHKPILSLPGFVLVVVESPRSRARALCARHGWQFEWMTEAGKGSGPAWEWPQAPAVFMLRRKGKEPKSKGCRVPRFGDINEVPCPSQEASIDWMRIRTN